MLDGLDIANTAFAFSPMVITFASAPLESPAQPPVRGHRHVQHIRVVLDWSLNPCLLVYSYCTFSVSSRGNDCLRGLRELCC